MKDVNDSSDMRAATFALGLANEIYKTCKAVVDSGDLAFAAYVLVATFPEDDMDPADTVERIRAIARLPGPVAVDPLRNKVLVVSLVGPHVLAPLDLPGPVAEAIIEGLMQADKGAQDRAKATAEAALAKACGSIH